MNNNGLPRKIVSTLLAIAILIVMTACGDTGSHKASLSESIEGEWYGEIDVAKVIYKPLIDELGIDITPNPAYCDVFLSFDGNGNFVMRIDKNGFANAVGQSVNPIVSAVFGIDMSFLIDILMEYVANDMPVDTGEETGTYFVDDDQLTVTMNSTDGKKEVMILNADGLLELYEEDSNQIIIFTKG